MLSKNRLLGDKSSNRPTWGIKFKFKFGCSGDGTILELGLWRILELGCRFYEDLNKKEERSLYDFSYPLRKKSSV